MRMKTRVMSKMSLMEMINDDGVVDDDGDGDGDSYPSRSTSSLV